MKLSRLTILYGISLLIVAGLVFSFTSTVYASEQGHNRGGMCNGRDNCDTTNIDESIDVDADASAEGGDAEAFAEGGDANAEASGTQNINIDSRRPGNSYIGGGNSSADDQKVFAIGGGWLTGNASFRLDLTDKDARVLRVAKEWKDEGKEDAANKLQCSVKVVYKPFGTPEKCLLAISPVPTTSIILPQAEYEALLMAQVSRDEYEEQQEMVEDKYTQQQSLIEDLTSQVAEHQDDQEELDRLKREAAALRAADEALAEKRASVRERYAQKAQAQETSDGPEGGI